jgi:hypothetical protein
MSDDQVMLGLHRRLHIVADNAGEAIAGDLRWLGLFEQLAGCR